MDSAFHISHRWELEWQDDIDMLTLGRGVQVKVLYEDKENEHVDMLIRFPAGYVEPRHNSRQQSFGCSCSRASRSPKPSPCDYLFADGSRPHGPFEYPEGCVVFASFRGTSAQHRYEGSRADDI